MRCANGHLLDALQPVDLAESREQQADREPGLLARRKRSRFFVFASGAQLARRLLVAVVLLESCAVSTAGARARRRAHPAATRSAARCGTPGSARRCAARATRGCPRPARSRRASPRRASEAGETGGVQLVDRHLADVGHREAERLDDHRLALRLVAVEREGLREDRDELVVARRAGAPSRRPRSSRDVSAVVAVSSRAEAIETDRELRRARDARRRAAARRRRGHRSRSTRACASPHFTSIMKSRTWRM